MKLMKLPCSFTTVLLALMPVAALALPASQQQEAREQARAAAIAASKAFGSQQQVVLEEPARSYVDWGAILQPNGTVVSVRDNSVAAAMGVQVGDTLTHINQQPINKRELATTLETFERMEHGEAFTITLARDNKVIELQGRAEAMVIPGWRLEVTNTVEDTALTNSNAENCGRISVFYTPPQTRDFYPAFINTINGENVRIRNPNFKLAVGPQKIGVHELISDPMVRRSRGIDTEKVLTIDIEPNQTYHIAAHFIREKRLSRRDGGYWEPVIWKVTEQNCTLN